MTNIIDFPTNVGYKVLFNLPAGKVLTMRKGPEDDFDIEIKENHGTAWIKATGKDNAKSRLLKVFPGSEIIEITIV